MRTLLLLAMSLLLTAAPAAAQGVAANDSQAMADARQLVDVLRLQSIRLQIIRATVQAMGQRLLAANKGHEAAAKSFIEQALLPAVRAHEPEIAEQQAHLFVQRFSADELHQLLAFYRSGVGAKLIATVPAMSGDMQKYASGWATDVLNEVKKKLGPDAKKRGVVMPK